MIDSHTHLSLCAPPDEELVAAARGAGVTRMLTVGTDPEGCRAALAAAERFPEVWAAVGRHPNACAGFGAAELDELRALASHPRCAAVGETGLDYFRQGAPAEEQQRAFRAHIGLARECGKPLVVHTRAAEEDTLELLEREATGLRVILHCFSMPERLEACLAHEAWFISFAGNVTYPANGALREAALRIPDERLLVETDAPYLAPQAGRGRPNTPAAVVLTAQALAVERRQSYAALEAAVEGNAAALFGW